MFLTVLWNSCVRAEVWSHGCVGLMAVCRGCYGCVARRLFAVVLHSGFIAHWKGAVTFSRRALRNVEFNFTLFKDQESCQKCKQS